MFAILQKKYAVLQFLRDVTRKMRSAPQESYAENRAISIQVYSPFIIVFCRSPPPLLVFVAFRRPSSDPFFCHPSRRKTAISGESEPQKTSEVDPRRGNGPPCQGGTVCWLEKAPATIEWATPIIENWPSKYRDGAAPSPARNIKRYGAPAIIFGAYGWYCGLPVRNENVKKGTRRCREAKMAHARAY